MAIALFRSVENLGTLSFDMVAALKVAGNFMFILITSTLVGIFFGKWRVIQLWSAL